MGRFLPSASLFSNITLNEKITNYDPKDNIIGTEGITFSDLRPSGSAIFDNKKIDVFTEGEFIQKNSKVKIISTKGSRTIVKSI